MKIVNPNNENHDIQLIPRYYPTDEITVELYNEATKIKYIVENIYVVDNGYLNLNFDFTFTEKDRFSIKITDVNGVVYRGKIYATAGETQDYKQSISRYEY